MAVVWSSPIKQTFVIAGANRGLRLVLLQVSWTQIGSFANVDHRRLRRALLAVVLLLFRFLLPTRFGFVVVVLSWCDLTLASPASSSPSSCSLTGTT